MNELLPNIPRFYTALAEWIACIFVILQFDKQTWKSSALIVLPFMGIGQIILQLLVGTWPLLFWIPGMILNVLWMLLTLYLAVDISQFSYFYNLCKAFIFAEFIASVSWQLFCVLFLRSTKHFAVPLVFMLMMYIIFSLFYYIFEKRSPHQVVLKNIKKREVVIAALSAIIIFTVSNMGFMFSQTFLVAGDGQSIFIFRTFINLCGLLILYIQEGMRYDIYLRSELSSINNVLQSQYEQYEAFKESNALVSQKFHDLKHQLDIIEMESEPAKRKEYVNQLKKDITQYQATVKTGNAIMDVILTRKNSFCIQNKITFTCIVDGKLLDFIEVMDLCSLLGNALDNAIESTLKNSDTDKRLINLRVEKKAGFVLFLLNNYSEDRLSFEDGLPQTTKDDKESHGYGLKSISYIVNKYDGTMTISHENNWFSLKVLLPIS
ncbi:GHKL domain-containing protein [Enterococcus sp. AZ072]|uniref:GHKL domain-containing protein n=1 Tax=unclassified Enterococcus TaxID=2608891 RepID=UPI003D2B1192